MWLLDFNHQPCERLYSSHDQFYQLFCLGLVDGQLFFNYRKGEFYHTLFYLKKFSFQKVVFSNIVGVLFFGKRIQAEGYESLDFLSQKFEHLLYFRWLSTNLVLDSIKKSVTVKDRLSLDFSSP